MGEETKRLPRPSVTAVFVHGLFSGPETWDPLVKLLSDDDVIRDAFRFERFAYSSPGFTLNPLRRIPNLTEIASEFDTWLKNLANDLEWPELALVGHSQGGLVIQKYLSVLLQDGKRGDDLRRIRAVVLLATPNTGSELFLSLRRNIEWIWNHPQEQGLRPYDEAIEDARKIVFERSVLAPVPNRGDCPIRFFVYAGESDNIVRARSAQWLFPRAGIVPGDHSTILQPGDRNDLRYQVVRSALRWARHSFPADGLIFNTGALDLGNPLEINRLLAIESARFNRRAGVSGNDLKHWLLNFQENWELRLSVLVARINGEPCAFTMFHESRDLIIVDYIAAEKKTRHSSLLVNLMVEQLTQRSVELGRARIVFEVEDPRASTDGALEARARIAYFEAKGARVIAGFEYLAPDMNTMSEGDESRYLLMYACPDQMPRTLSGKEVEEIIRRIYLVWYRNWFSHYPDAERRERYLQALFEKGRKSLQAQYDLPERWRASA